MAATGKSTSISAPSSTEHRSRILRKSEKPAVLAKVVQRPRTPAIKIPEVSITTLRHLDQLKVLTEIADSEVPWSIKRNLGRIKKHIGGDIKLVAKAQARRGTRLRSQELLNVALSAVATGPLGDASRQSAFSELRAQPPEIQRGRLHAMHVFQKSGIAQELPDVAADALVSLLTDRRTRSRGAKELLNHFNQRLDDFVAELEDREETLTYRFETLGAKKLLEPALRTDYPEDENRQRVALDEIRRAGKLQEKILICCKGLRVLEEKEQVLNPDDRTLDPRLLAVVDELEHIVRALGQSAAGAAKVAVKTMAKYLTEMLRLQLPASVQVQLTSLLDKPDSKARRAEIKALLRSPMTSPDQLIGILKSDAEVFEALQILWGGAPVYSLRFARNLSEMLLITDKHSELLQDVESKLLARLGPEKLGNYAVQRLRETRKAKPDDEPRSQLVVDSIMRVMTPPSKDKDVDRKLEKLVKMQTGQIKTSSSQEQLATQRRQVLEGAEYAVTPDTRPHQDMLAWLEAKKSPALKAEAAQRPPNPMPKRPRLVRINARARLFDGAKLKPKIVAPAPQAIPVNAVPVSQALPVAAVPVQQATPGAKRILKRRFIRQP